MFEEIGSDKNWCFIFTYIYIHAPVSARMYIL